MDSYQSAKEEVKRAVDIVELVGQFVQLKRAGQNYLGLCPFHSEKEPSFTVSPSKQMFHCFGCKKGGDVFAFWMTYHQASFPQSLKDLAEKYHVPLPRGHSAFFETGAKDNKESIVRINEKAAEFFHHVLTKTDRGKSGAEYFQKRSIGREIISEFRLGYAPDEWDGLTSFLIKKKADLEKAAEAGLIIPKKTGGYYDRFRNRVVFPILDLRQEIVGFGARVLDHSLPKYLNTPETPIFHKGELLYGLHLAFGSIRQSGRAIIVEGYTDVLALKKHGFHLAVATLGTALTKHHIRRLKGYAKEVLVVFDSDTAGRIAALRSLPLFLEEGLTSKVIVLPEGDDPDSFVNKNGLAAFHHLLDRALPLFDFCLDIRAAGAATQIEEQVRVLKDMIPVLSELKDEAQRSFCVRRISMKLDISESVVWAELKKWMTRPSGTDAQTDLRKRLSDRRLPKWDDLYLLNLLVHYPHCKDRLLNSGFKVFLSDPCIIRIFDSVMEMGSGETDLTPAAILERLGCEEDRERFREAILNPPICPMEGVEEVIRGFEYRVQKIRMTESNITARKRGDLEASNKILEQKRGKEAGCSR